MNFSASEARASRLWFDADSMWVALTDGRILAIPKAWFPKLSGASDETLEDYELSGHGLGIHWDKLDEDISVPDLLRGNPARSPSARQMA